MTKRRVVQAKEVEGFCPAELGGAYISRMLLEKDGLGSTRLLINHVTMKPHHPLLTGGSHPAPYDEAYYILRGQARVSFDEGRDSYDVGPDTVAFIPGGAWHTIQNTGEDDLEFLTLWPMTPDREGVNGIMDERQHAWGTGFKLAK